MFPLSSLSSRSITGRETPRRRLKQFQPQLPDSELNLWLAIKDRSVFPMMEAVYLSAMRLRLLEPDPEDAVPNEEKVVLDLWHWNDDYVQPMQKVRAIAMRNRSYRAVWHIKEKKFVQLADPSMENVMPNSGGLYAIGSDDRSYRKEQNYDTSYSDYYLVNTLDGSRRLLQKKIRFGLSWSPDGKYAVFFDGKDWNSISIPDGKVTNLTRKLGVSFAREENDLPIAPSSYGLAGWTKDDKQVLLYDRYDIWIVSANGSSAKC